MHLFWKVYLGVCGAAWLGAAVRAWLGMRRVPHLRDVTPLADGLCPPAAILFAARDEVDKLPAALPTMLAQDYPRYEVVSVDDRSTDGTGQILDEFARQGAASTGLAEASAGLSPVSPDAAAGAGGGAPERHAKLTVIHIRELPPGWLGKPHALTAASARTQADWLVFTDADVHFQPELLRRAVSLAVENHWDQLTLLGPLELKGFFEQTMISFFGLGVVLAYDPWQASNPRSGVYLGVGAFQMVRRSVYEAVGGHRRLAMEVIDDMKLGKLVKQNGFRPGVAFHDGLGRVRWLEGLKNVIGGLTKNAFAASDFSLALTAGRIAGLFGMSIVPWLVLLLGGNETRLWAAFPVAVMAITHAAVAPVMGASPLYGLTHPLGALLSAYVMAQSAAVTLVRGGIVWRGTRYSLDQLRKGRV